MAPAFLSSHALRLILFGGKGGVGKTTCAAATALTLAERHPESSYLLVSTDPAHSLADSLAGSVLPSNLTVTELDAQECLAVFKKAHGEELKEIAARGTFLDDDDIRQFLDLSLPGIDELMAFLEIARWVEEDRHACVVVDTAPWGHTLRLLSMPKVMREWIEALDALLAKHRYLKELYSGVRRRDALDEFLSALTASVDRIRKTMSDPVRCRFVPVVLAERLSVTETIGLVADLKRLSIPVTELVINRLYPDFSCPVCADGRARQLNEIARVREELPGHLLWGLPLFPDEVSGRKRLEALWGEAARAADSPSTPRLVASVSPRVINALPPPAPGMTLMIFAGKGGVGKTTLACATALRLSGERPERRILLFSTDPAHSLSDCLGQPIGAEPTRLSPGLTAIEINAEAELNALKQRYAIELERFLYSLSPNLDLTFDRAVMERILDLSPPGLDEVMALSRAMEFLAGGTYHVLILDAAPTGHLIRLIEMPELIDRWLKVFFRLFLKYKGVFRVRGLSEQLVTLSKNLKRFRTLLTDARRTSLCAVTIPTEMGFAETADLLAACDRMKVSAPVLFINLATPKRNCPLCAALRHRESCVEARFADAFAGTHQVLVYRCGDPRGTQQLGQFGRTLYRSA